MDIINFGEEAENTTKLEALLNAVNSEDTFLFDLVSCDDFKASVARAFDMWAANSRHIKFVDVSTGISTVYAGFPEGSSGDTIGGINEARFQRPEAIAIEPGCSRR